MKCSLRASLSFIAASGVALLLGTGAAWATSGAHNLMLAQNEAGGNAKTIAKSNTQKEREAHWQRHEERMRQEEERARQLEQRGMEEVQEGIEMQQRALEERQKIIEQRAQWMKQWQEEQRQQDGGTGTD